MEHQRILSVFVLSFFILFLPFSSASLLDGLESHFDFDKPSTATTESSDFGSYSLTQRIIGNGVATFETGGVIGNSTYINSSTSATNYAGWNINNQILYTGTPVPSNFRDYTFNSWVNIRSFDHSGPDVIQPILAQDFGNVNFMIGVVNSSPGGSFGYIVYSSNKVGSSRATTKPINRNEWTMVSVTYDNSSNTSVIYVNAQVVASFTGKAQNNCGTCAQRIGLLSPDSGASTNFYGQFSGNIDELASWTRVLTSDEITQLYDNGNALPYFAYDSPDAQQIAQIPDIEMSYGDLRNIFMDDYFTDFSSITVEFTDTINSQYVILEADIGGSSDTYANKYFTMSLDPIADTVRLRITTNDTGFLPYTTTLAIGAHGYTGSVGEGVGFTIQNTGTEPQREATLQDYIAVPFNFDLYYQLGDFYDYITDATVYFYDPINRTVRYLATNGTFSDTQQTTYSYNNGTPYLSVFLQWNGFDSITWNIQSYSVSTIIDFTLLVDNGQAFTEDTLQYYIDPTLNLSSLLPKLKKNPSPITLYSNQSTYLIVSDYFSNYQSFKIQYIEGGFIRTVAKGVTREHALFNITGTNLGAVVKVKDIEGNTQFSFPFKLDVILTTSNTFGTNTTTQPILIGRKSDSGIPSSLNGNNVTAGTLLGSIVTGFKNLFPDADNLSLGTRLAYPVVLILLTFVLIIFVTYPMITVGAVIAGVLSVLEIFFFTAIGYIPIFLVVMLAILCGLVIYFILNKGGVNG